MGFSVIFLVTLFYQSRLLWIFPEAQKARSFSSSARSHLYTTLHYTAMHYAAPRSFKIAFFWPCILKNMSKRSIFAPYGWKIKLHVLYIQYYREWLCNGRCISTGLIENRNTVEQTAHFSLLSRKKLSKITTTPFHREIGRHYLWPWTEHYNHAPLEKHGNDYTSPPCLRIR